MRVHLMHIPSTRTHACTHTDLFTVQISSLKNINVGFEALIGIMLGFFGLTFLYNVYQPPYKQKENAFVEFKY